LGNLVTPESIRNLQRKLYRKAKNDVVQGRGTRRFSDEVLYKQYGLVRLMDVLARRRSNACGEIQSESRMR
jgi:hypothetical protein